MALSDDERLLEHNYDGIQEYDNPLPRWWVYLFWATILLVPVYYLVPGTMGAGGTKERLYADEMERFKREHPELAAPAPTSASSDEELLALVQRPDVIVAGKAAFAQNCAACHGPAGGGVIGPNLTDDAWLHGGKPAEIHHTIEAGVLAKGMPAWGKLLKPDVVNAVVAYVATLHGTNPPNPKEPQGTVETH